MAKRYKRVTKVQTSKLKNFDKLNAQHQKAVVTMFKRGAKLETIQSKTAAYYRGEMGAKYKAAQKNPNYLKHLDIALKKNLAIKEPTIHDLKERYKLNKQIFKSQMAQARSLMAKQEIKHQYDEWKADYNTKKNRHTPRDKYYKSGWRRDSIENFIQNNYAEELEKLTNPVYDEKGNIVKEAMSWDDAIQALKIQALEEDHTLEVLPNGAIGYFDGNDFIVIYSPD